MLSTGKTLQEIASAVGGVVEGDGAILIRGVAGLHDARPGDISFLANPRYASQMAGTQASAVMVRTDWTGECAAAQVRVANPDQAFMKVAIMLAPAPIIPPVGVHPTAVVAPDAVLGEGVSIGPFCVIEAGAHIGAGTTIGAHGYIGHESTIGEKCLFHSLVSVRERTRIGSRVILHNGAVIGSDGFGYTPVEGRWVKIPQIGTVEIGDDVEIGANVTIDRARFGRTVIGNGCKIDNLVQIAHNVQVGAHTAMAAQVGISGSAIIGANVQIGGQVGIAGHLKVNDRAILGAQCGVSKEVGAGEFMFGSPAMPMSRYKRIHAHYAHLPELKKRVDELERRLEQVDPGCRNKGDSPA